MDYTFSEVEKCKNLFFFNIASLFTADVLSTVNQLHIHLIEMRLSLFK